MSELEDYSGPFKPDLKWEDFSKDFLLKVMKVWQYFYLEMASAWYDAVDKRWGFDGANECEQEAWVRVVERLLPRLANVANIELNTVLDSLKVMQLPPDNTLDMYPVEYDIKDENHVVVTIRKCSGLEYWERERPERIKAMCQGTALVLDPKYSVNPKVKGKALKLPPRKSRNEPACVWEWTLEE
jgi:hypothetical protein